jgi:ribonuclease PH
MSFIRPDGRKADELRPISWQRNFTNFAAGSVLATFGNTKVLCSVSIQNTVPKFLLGSGKGWLTAEYRMLPSATLPRQEREFLKLSGRTQEIQRLIGRSLRAALDLSLLGERTIIVDADVLQADAGTRTTAITGGYVALVDGINHLLNQGEIERSPIIHQIAAISVGLIENELFLDLNYPEDLAASVDFNIVMNEQLELIEIQGTAEEKSFNRKQLNEMLDLAEKGIKELMIVQNQ